MDCPCSKELNPGNVKKLLSKLFQESLKAVAPNEDVEPLVAASFGEPASQKGRVVRGHYQCNNAMALYAKLGGGNAAFAGPISVGKAISENLPTSDMIESCSVSGPGFVNIVLSKTWMAKTIQTMLIEGIDTWAPKLEAKKAVVDFSSPNIAKELHVGHLRSTIIGDSIARMLEFANVQVLRRNHVGDWGTQFGMLIEFLFKEQKGWQDNGTFSVQKLQELYRESKKKFDSDDDFKDAARKAVVKLQGGDSKYRQAWEKICDISRSEYQKLYERLQVDLEEKGESFYHPFIPNVLEELRNKGLVKEDEGAQVISFGDKNEEEKRPDGKSNSPRLIVVKTDGGFNYASTDFAALWYRLYKESADWIIYVTDKGQSEHFGTIFRAAKEAGWLPQDEAYPKATHVPFGLVLGEDGKRYRTRSSEVPSLAALLDEAITRSRMVLAERGKMADDELEDCAEAIGYGAVKYADLKSNRTTDYFFDIDRMLEDKGDTVAFLQYEHARVSSVIQKSGKNIEELKKTTSVQLDHESELALALRLLEFSEVIEEACNNLLPSVVCNYLYNLAKDLSSYYHTCKVIGTAEEDSRLLLYGATAAVMQKCFYLLGITPVNKM